MFPNFTLPKAIYKWFRYDIWVGQQLTYNAEDEYIPSAPPTWYQRHCHKPLMAILLPALFVQCIWWIYMAATDRFHLFTDDIHGMSRYTLSLAMAVASFVSGASCQGGGSITFPLITVGFHLLPAVARDFSYLIQAVAMSAAAVSIFYLRLEIEYASLIYCSIGGIFGIGICLHYVADHIPPDFAKMYYVAIWFAFALNLFILNRKSGRKVYGSIPHWEGGAVIHFNLGRHHGTVNWKALVLILGGFIGGLFSGFAANGIDICSFAILTLLFRVSEKTATPTSVILMAINTLLAFAWRWWIEDAVSPQSYDYFLVSVPIAALGAPLGAVVASYLDRRCFSRFVYFANITQLIGAFQIIKPWEVEFGLFLTVSCLVLIVVASAVWAVVVHIGAMIIDEFEQQEGSGKVDHVVITRGGELLDCDLDSVTTKGTLDETQPLLPQSRMEL